MEKDIKTKTRAYSYVLPAIAEFIKIDKSQLVNCFLGVEGITKDYDGKVYLVFTFNEDNVRYENYLMEHETCSLHKDLTSEYFLIGVDVPIEYYTTVYINYINGRFSKFPLKYKQTILKYHNLPNNSLQHKILYKHPILLKELTTKLEISEEYIEELGEMPTYESDCLYNYMYEYK